jgi:hypothetical protein
MILPRCSSRPTFDPAGRAGVHTIGSELARRIFTSQAWSVRRPAKLHHAAADVDREDNHAPGSVP